MLPAVQGFSGCLSAARSGRSEWKRKHASSHAGHAFVHIAEDDTWFFELMSRNLQELQVGEAFGRYELLLPVARGGMSRVWAARLRGTRGFQKLVAIKTLVADEAEVHRLEPMLLAEARLAAQIQHPNVAQYLDLGERDGVLYVVMEWVEGESLTALIRSAAPRGGIPLAISAQIVAQACNGLHGAHELHDARGESLGLVHCDVSPHNLMISASGTVKVIDFGIAKARRGSPMAGQEGLVAGKLAFMAPEQARGGVVDRRADIFSLGITLYLLSTGRHPFGSGTPSETLDRIVRNSPVIPPCAADPRYPAALERVVMRALTHDPRDRYESAAEMLYELSAAVDLAHEIEVGTFLRDVCQDSLLERHLRVTQALEQAAAREEQGTPVPAPFVSVAPDPSPSATGLQSLQHASTTAPAATDVFLAEPPPVRRRSGRWLAATCALLGALGVGSWYARGLSPVLAEFYRPLAAFSQGGGTHAAAPAPALAPARPAAPAASLLAPPAAPAGTTVSNAGAAPGSVAVAPPPAEKASRAPARTKAGSRRARCIGANCGPSAGAPAAGADAQIIQHYGI